MAFVICNVISRLTPRTTRCVQVVRIMLSRSESSKSEGQGSADMSHSQLFELRTYNIYPQHLKEFLELSSKWMHIRSKHSKMIGYWSCELGGINQLVHLWEYDSFDQRMEVRKKLASDPEWVGSYFSKILNWMSLQDNTVLSLLPFAILNEDLTPGGVYELQTFQFSEPDVNKWMKVLHDYNLAREKDLNLVGAFRTSMAGEINTCVQLWNYSSPAKLDSVTANSSKDPNLTDKYATLLAKVSKESRKILIPQPWSPLK